MTAKGKINASKVQAGDRILIQTGELDWNGNRHPAISRTKTGEGVAVARVIRKGFRQAGIMEARGWYVIETTAGTVEAQPIQTMWLAPEDAAGIKRAHAEALAEDRQRELVQHEARILELAHAEALDENDTRDMVQNNQRVVVPVTIASAADTGELETLAADAEKIIAAATGSGIIRTLEKVWARLQADHSELPDVVIVTGSGMIQASKWGHFGAARWTNRQATGGPARGEVFLAGEALAKGSRQVLQTMIHEAAHALSAVREVQDTSRQGRWHNAKFKDAASELGLEHRGEKADKSHGWSSVTLRQSTIDRYADLMAELDTEIDLVIGLPGWLGGDGEAEGGEKIGAGQKSPGEGGTTAGAVKLTCACEEPNIIRASKKVAAKPIICGDCDEKYLER